MVEVLERFPGEEGTEAVITKGARGWHVTFRDTDAQQSVLTVICPSLESAHEKAHSWTTTPKAASLAL